MNKKLYYLLGILLLLIGWIGLYFYYDNPLVIPSPIDVLEGLINLFSSKPIKINMGETIISLDNTLDNIIATLIRTLKAFIISYIIGLIFASIAAKSEKIEELFKPLFSTLRAIPTISLIFVFIMIIGFVKAPYYIVFIISFPIIYQSILEGYKNIDSELKLVNKLDNYNPIKNYIMFTFPMLKTSLITAFISSFALSFKIEVMAEILTGSPRLKGLGFLIWDNRNYNNISMVISLSLLIIILSIVLEFIGKMLLKLIKE